MASTIEKQIWLVDTINRHGRITFRELSRIWEDNDSLNPDGEPLSERTFHRHREDIDRIFGLEIKCDKSDMNRYYIEDDVEGKNVRTWLLSTLAVDNIVNQSKELKDRIQYEKIPSGQQFLTTIISSMKDGRKLKMVYHSFWHDVDDEVLLEPYFVKVDSQRWYVIGPSDIHPGDPHIYSLDRIKTIEPTKLKYKYPKSFDPSAYFSDDFGIFHVSGEPQSIRLKVSKYQCNYFESLKIHESQVCVEETPDYNIYLLRLRPNLQFYQRLLSYGADVEVLSPQNVRDEMAGKLEAASELYK